MTENRRSPLDIQQLVLEARSRWLRPAEICEILQNYKSFQIAPEPPQLPQSGSLFLFDRKVLRYFRKDGHIWRKKRDGKTVKEAHERLKSGSIDVLHCYYAHGEENENFQRRCYWMLEENLSHIVLVHYLEVKGGSRTNHSCIKEYGEAITYSQEMIDPAPNFEMDTSVSSNLYPKSCHLPAQTPDTVSMNSAQASEYEDVESVYNHQASSGFHSFFEVQEPEMEHIGADISNTYDPLLISGDNQGKLSAIPVLDFMSLAQTDKDKDTNSPGLTYEIQKHLDLPSWDDFLGNSNPGKESATFPPLSSSQADMYGTVSKQEGEELGHLFTNSFIRRQEFGNNLLVQEEWQDCKGSSLNLSKPAMDQKLHPDSTYDLITRVPEQELNTSDLIYALDPFHKQENDHPVQNDFQIQLSDAELGMTQEGKPTYSLSVKQQLLEGSLSEEGLKKLDSFSRWMSRELGDVNEQHVQTDSGAYWDTVENENEIDDSNISQAHLDSYVLGPSVSKDQLFSIIDFSPNWAYPSSEVKVLITGRFLKSQEEVESCKWSCMYGEVEVPAEIIAHGVLRCHTPLLKAGRVPFYITCSNRIACSEVREFEFRDVNTQDTDIIDNCSSSSSGCENLSIRFGKLLCLSSASPPKYGASHVGEISELSSKISSLLKEDNDEWDEMLKLSSEEGISLEDVKEQLLQKMLKQKLHNWLLQKVAEEGKGPSELDKGGQGALHFAAALDYDWALEPTIIAGVNVNFRDVNGWTALHWAASCGRERTVATLINLGAAPGALTDPTPKYPKGRTPADLASTNGHKGIAGFLAEFSLSTHLDSLNLDKQNGNAAEVSAVSECTATPVSDRELSDGLSLKDSLAAVRNAAQAAARIQQVFRAQSFQRRQIKEYGDGRHGMSDEHALSLIAVKTHKPSQRDEPVHAAAVRIQNKFRSWKGRKDFLIIRQRVIKIQAHVRGHQVRKNYRNITWSVGVLEKIILRWRRKGSGLRGFRSDTLIEGPSKQDKSSKEDDYDFFKEGRKQTEERSQIALARVKSMVNYPEARDQYSRLRNVVTEIQEAKAMRDWVKNSESTAKFEDMIDLEALLDDDLFMPMTS